MINISGIKKTYDGRTVLDIPSIDLEEGKIYAVIGANGSGKSTMAKLLSKAVSSDEKMVINGVGSMGYLPQKPYAFNMSLEKNLRINAGQEVNEEKIKGLLESLKIQELANENARKLSGGENARMALARLLMKDYSFLVLDEPTAAMDVESTLITESVLNQYRLKTGCTILLITHELNQAKRLADEVIFMEDGKLVEMGESDEVLMNPKDERTRKYIEFYSI